MTRWRVGLEKAILTADIELQRGRIGSAAREPADGPRPEERSAIVYTSGTTGPSKGRDALEPQQFFLGSTFSENFLIEADSVLYHYSRLTTTSRAGSCSWQRS